MRASLSPEFIIAASLTGVRLETLIGVCSIYARSHEFQLLWTKGTR